MGRATQGIPSRDLNRRSNTVAIGDIVNAKMRYDSDFMFAEEVTFELVRIHSRTRPKYECRYLNSDVLERFDEVRFVRKNTHSPTVSDTSNSVLYAAQ